MVTITPCHLSWPVCTDGIFPEIMSIYAKAIHTKVDPHIGQLTGRLIVDSAQYGINLTLAAVMLICRAADSGISHLTVLDYGKIQELMAMYGQAATRHGWIPQNGGRISITGHQ